MRSSLISLFLLAMVSSISAQPLRVVTNESKPFFYLDDGNPAGLEYDILRYFAEAQGREVEIHWVESFEQILPMIERGEGDVAASTYEELLSAVPGARFIYAKNDKEMYELVASGKARALASDSAVAFPQLEEFDSLRLGIPLSETQNYGFALSKASPLTKLLTEHILQLKASGIYFRLLEQHLGAEAVEVVKAGRVQ